MKATSPVSTKIPKTGQTMAGFYVEEGCCMSCGVPQSIAPELVGWREEGEPRAIGFGGRRVRRK